MLRAGAAVLAAAALMSACTSSAEPPIRAPHTSVSSAGSSAPTADAPTLDRAKTVSGLLDAAHDAAVSVNSYDYRHMSSARKAAEKATTGTFHDKIGRVFDLLDVQAPKRKQLQQLTVAQVGLVSLGTKALHAEVLVAGTLRTQREDTNPAVAAFARQVSFTSVDGDWLISAQEPSTKPGAAPSGDTALTDAFTAARQHLADVYSYARKSFDKDYDHALSLTTGTARDALARRRDSIRQGMDRQSVDYRATLAGLGVTAVDDDGGVRLLALVDVTGVYNGVAGATQHRAFDVTMRREGDDWLVADFPVVGASQ